MGWTVAAGRSGTRSSSVSASVFAATLVVFFPSTYIRSPIVAVHSTYYTDTLIVVVVATPVT